MIYRHISASEIPTDQVVLLVRHPITAVWSEFQRRLNLEQGSHGGGGHVGAIKKLDVKEARAFVEWSRCMACRWAQVRAEEEQRFDCPYTRYC